ncbi:hypothetical protein WA026_006235 [Henosepilachna vigintioctopunctata]|uniref:MGA conserved domain-containing protein n=1 Tax=Henosepilachna vigintioctopunctata TaxID=420089 RepID=A0AAW1TK47_9CUCU
MGRRKEESGDTIVCDIEPERNSVASVIDDIIKYIEIKELGDSIIKDAEPYVEEECEVGSSSPVMKNDINVVEDDIGKKSIKRRKLEMELQRLSCKVVNVTVEDKEIMNNDCNKSYCKLGCICRSLTSTLHLPFNYQHCSKKVCMFECKCSAANGDVSLSGDISVLTSDTVTRIEDQAKRNLARVEKEFTQTIIHANDNTILIPSSDRNKTKRLKRAPKRYSDFLENYNVEQENAIVQNEKSKMWQNFELFSCFVKLQKLDINTVVPLCLDHNCYDCYCLKNIVPLNENKNKRNDEENVEENVPPKKLKKLNSDEENVEENVPPKKLKKLNNDEKNVEENVPPNKLKKLKNDEKNVEENVPPNKLKKLKNDEKNVEENVPPNKLKKLKKDNGTKNNESNTNLKNQSSTRSDPENDNISNSIRKIKQCEGCARIRAVRPEISARNEIPFYKDKLRVRIRNYQRQHKSPSPINIQYEEKDSSIIDVTTPLTILACDRLKYFLTARKRKQVHEVREDYETAPSSSKVKKMTKQHKSVQEFSREPIKEPITQSELPYARIFDGEIVIPTNANKDFVKNLGVKRVAPYMRLLTWNNLLKNYYSKKINIWCSVKSDKVLINRSNIKAPEGYIDIKKSNKRNGIMMWILAKELPKQTPPELVHLILSPNMNHFEISGICLKNTPNSQEGEQIEKVNNQKHNEDKHDHIEEMHEIVTDNANAEKPDNQDSNVLEHKNHKNEFSVLFLTKHEFSPQDFYLAEVCNTYNEKFPLSIELPLSHTNCRWRMLYLNSNFSLLSFISNKYSIKYTDLMYILREAQNSNKTIFLNNKQLSSGYSHKYFGIYAVPKYADRLFIGPYGLKEEHGLETLRYLRKSLVTTSFFEMVQGVAKRGKKNALWLSTIKTNMIDSSQLSLLHSPAQHSLLKSNKVCINRKEKANNSSRKNEDLADLTPIINLNSPISNIHSIDDETVEVSELRSTSFSETNNQTDQRIELQGIHEHSELLEGCETFISSTDLEDKPFIEFPEFILLNDKKLKPEDYNRYIMTNIPYFGYLGAKKTEQSKSIYVNWPFGDKTLQFPSVTAATEFLRRRFTNLLLPIPASFQMNFIIMREIDPTHHSPINAKILNGTHICGEFGVLDSRQLTSTLAKSLGTTQDDVLKRLAKRAHYLVRCRLRTLGLFLLPKDEKLGEVLDNVAYVTNLVII